MAAERETGHEVLDSSGSENERDESRNNRRIKTSSDIPSTSDDGRDMGRDIIAMQQVLTDGLQRGFSKLTEAIASQLSNATKQGRTRTRSASESSDSVASVASETRKATKRARRESTGDVDVEVDELLAGNDPNTTSNVASAQNEEDVLGSIAEEYNLDEQCAEEVNPKLASIVNKMVRNRLTDEKLKEKLTQSTRPTNCENIVGTKINPEIWPKLKSSTRSRDIKLQRVQNMLLKASIPVVKVIHKLMQADSSQLDDNKSLIRSLMDSMAILGHTNYEFVQRRRELIRPDLNDKYQQLCGEHIEFTNWLFGDDLPKQVQDISATNRVSQQLASSRQYDRQNGTGSYSRHSHRPRDHYGQNFRQGPRWHKPPYRGKKRHQKDCQKQQ